MAIFKKLNIGDTVASSGTRVFKKLTMGDPVWNGTDLAGTKWNIPAGWAADAGYGQFDVDGFWRIDGAGQYGFSRLCIGFENTSGGTYETNFTAAPNSIVILTFVTSKLDPEKTNTFRFRGGADSTNQRLINWLLEYGEFVSYTPIAASQ